MARYINALVLSIIPILLTACPNSALTVIQFSINSGTATTETRTVDLTSTVIGYPTHFMISESPEFEGASWLTYNRKTTFELSSANGSKTVYFKAKSSIGESAVASDTILLAEEKEFYEFVSVWPELPYPWYFTQTLDTIAIGPDGRVYLVDQGCIWQLSQNGEIVSHFGDSGETAIFYDAEALAIGADSSIYVCDSGQRRIEKFASNGQFLCAWGNSGSQQERLSYPKGVAVGTDGFVYVADTGNDEVKKYTPTGALITQWQTFQPQSITIDRDNYVYVAGNGWIYKFSSTGQTIDSWSFVNTTRPEDVKWSITASNDGTIFVSGGSSIRRFTDSGEPLNQWSIGENEYDYLRTRSLAVGADGTLYITSLWPARVERFTPTGDFLEQWGSAGFGDGEFRNPCSIAITPDQTILVGDESRRLQELDLTGKWLDSWEIFALGQMAAGHDRTILFSGYNTIEKFDLVDESFSILASCPTMDVFCTDPDGIIYALDSDLHLMQRLSVSGEYLNSWQCCGGESMAASSDAIYVCDILNDRILKYTHEGELVTEWGRHGERNGEFSYPYLITVAGDGTVIVCDGDRFQKFTSNGAFLASSKIDQVSRFVLPIGVVADSHGAIYVLNREMSCVMKYVKVDNLN